MGTRSGSGPPPPPDAGRFDDARFGAAVVEVLDSATEESENEDEDEDQDEDRAAPGDVKRAPLARQPLAGAPGAKAGKKTRGRVKIKMAFIDNKLRRYTTFSKRKTGIMKKAYELSTLTATQLLLLVASETGHVYTFATRKLQPIITSEAGKALIRTCLNSPEPSCQQRMSAAGFQEAEFAYQDLRKGLLSGPNMAAGPPPAQVGAANGTPLKPPAGRTTLMSGGGVSQVPSTNPSPSDIPGPASSAGHVMDPGGHALMYAPAAPVLNAATHEPASVPQVFLASLPPVSAVQLHPMVLSQQNGGGGANLTELQLVSVDD
ncbi:serum response factor-like isoform X2 [Festucalex cinctus]